MISDFIFYKLRILCTVYPIYIKVRGLCVRFKDLFFILTKQYAEDLILAIRINTNGSDFNYRTGTLKPNHSRSHKIDG